MSGKDQASLSIQQKRRKQNWKVRRRVRRQGALLTRLGSRVMHINKQTGPAGSWVKPMGQPAPVMLGFFSGLSNMTSSFSDVRFLRNQSTDGKAAMAINS